MKTAYFVLGVHRSGASAVGGVLNILELNFGSDLMASNEANPKGYYENNNVYRLNNAVLEENGVSWDDCHFDFSDIPKKNRDRHIDEAKEVLNSEFVEDQDFVIKAPRNCLLFPIWEQACAELGINIKVILPYRNPMEVAESLQKRDGFGIQKGLNLWLHQFLLAEYFSRDYERLFLSFDALLHESKQTVEKLSDFTQIKKEKKQKHKKKQQEVEAFLETSLKHNNISFSQLRHEFPSYFQELITCLEKGAFENFEVFDVARENFDVSKKLFMYPDQRQSDQITNLQAQLKSSQEQEVEKDAVILTMKKQLEHETTQNQQLEVVGKEFQEREASLTKEIDLVLEDMVYVKEQNLEVQEALTKEMDLVLEDMVYVKEQNLEVQEHLQNRLENQEQELLLKESKLTALDLEIKKLTEGYEDRLAIERKGKEKLLQELQSEQKSHQDRSTYIKTLEKQLEVKVAKLTTLDQEVKKLTESYEHRLAVESESKEKLLQELQSEQKSFQEKNTYVQALELQLQSLEEKITHIEEEYQHSLTKIQKLHNVLEEQSQVVLQKEKEIEDLNTVITEVVFDLVTIKESKCWLYTKPLREIQKVFKGEDSE